MTHHLVTFNANKGLPESINGLRNVQVELWRRCGEQLLSLTTTVGRGRLFYMEATEMQDFSKQLKEGGEESLTHISLAISILAVLVAMVTVLGHRTHTEAVLSQTRAADQWNEYQAKKIRSDNLSLAVDTLVLDTGLSQTPAGKTAVDNKLQEYRGHLDKWRDDLADQQKKAHEFEADVDRAEHHASRFDLGEALLQIAVVVCSITLFTRRKPYFFLGLTVGAIGLLVALSAFVTSAG